MTASARLVPGLDARVPAAGLTEAGGDARGLLQPGLVIAAATQ